LKAKYDLNCVESTVKPQSINQLSVVSFFNGFWSNAEGVH